jgi:hypothetical protein
MCGMQVHVLRHKDLTRLREIKQLLPSESVGTIKTFSAKLIKGLYIYNRIQI